MRKFFKFIVILAAVFIALLAIAALCIRLFFPPAKVKKLIDAQIRAQLHREAKLQDVRLGLGGLRLIGFQLSEVPSFSAGTFLSVDRMDIGWSLAPLLKKHVAIKHVILQKPQIRIIQMADGKTTNLSDLAGLAGSAPSDQKPTTAKNPPPPSGASDWTWKVDEIRLEQGLVTYEDRAKSQLSTKLSGINLKVRDFSADQMQGTLALGQVENVFYKGKDLVSDWSLKHIDPSLSHVSGYIKLKQGPGILRNMNELANISKSLRVALAPLITLQNLSKSGFVNIGLPDLSHLNLNAVQGDYALNDGNMKINQLQLNGPEVSISAPGTINLASGALAMEIVMHTPQPTMMGSTELKLHVGGTLTHPTTDLSSLKKQAFKATIKGVMDNPENQKKLNKALQNIFH
jgi:uncharacterized protein involved in outer membrane biogenesis